jgi:hypothetical protein
MGDTCRSSAAALIRWCLAGVSGFDVWLFDEYMRRGYYTAEDRLGAFLERLIQEGQRLSSGSG